MHYKAVRRCLNSYKMNWVIKVLIASDFLIWSSNQLFSPIFAVFITLEVLGGSVEVVGIAMALYLVVKSIFEIPVGIFIDRSTSEKDDLYTAIIGTVLTAVALFSYNFVTEVWHLYLVQTFYGIAAAISHPGRYSIFTKHIDSSKEAFEWSMYDVFLGLGMAAAAALGGFMADIYGFNSLFNIAAVFTLSGAFLLLTIKNKIRK